MATEKDVRADASKVQDRTGLIYMQTLLSILSKCALPELGSSDSYS